MLFEIDPFATQHNYFERAPNKYVSIAIMHAKDVTREFSEFITIDKI